MSRIKCAALIIPVVLVLLSGCSLPLGVAPVNGTDQDPAAQTAMAAALEETLTAMANGEAPIGLNPSLTFTPEVLLISVSTETFCRSGPGEPYDVLGTLKVGQNAEVVGRNAYGDTWIIILPTTPPITCWMWNGYATLVGNSEGVPVIDPPPTPTPQPGFDFAFHAVGYGPSRQCLFFSVTNTGGTNWESYTLSARDITKGVTTSISNNDFVNYDEVLCNPGGSQGELAPGESGTASVITHLVGSISADNFEATLTLWSGDKSGTSLVKTTTFSP
jgi:hypothetical protein